mgnify:CR=1 FL=1
MTSEMKAEPAKCSCGGTLVPTMMNQKIKEKGDDFEQRIDIEWTCEKCGKVIKR